ncbi:peroxidase [Ranunculus cassubicifolius]
MDPSSSNRFDLDYYKSLLEHRGLFQSDAALVTDPASVSMIRGILDGKIDFFLEFSKSMEKLVNIEVKEGNDGEVRKHCAFLNH